MAAVDDPRRFATSSRLIPRRLGALAVAVPCIFLACARDDVPGTEGIGGSSFPGGVLGAVSELVDLELVDAGYGASILLHNEHGTSGSMAFQSRTEAGGNELRLLRWAGDDGDGDAAIDFVDEGVGDVLELLGQAESARLQIVGSQRDGGLSRLMLWRETGDGWTPAVLDDNGDVGRYLAAATDGTGGVHVAYLEPDVGQLRYLLWQDGALAVGVEVVDTGQDPGQVLPGGDLNFAVGMDLDPAGQPLVSYYDATNGQLRTARRSTDGTWAVQVVGPTVRGRVLAPDPEGVVAIPGRFVPRPSQFVVYADGAPLSDGSVRLISDEAFQIEGFDPAVEYSMDYVEPVGSDYGSWSSVAVAGSGTAYVSFFDAGRGNLGIATQAAGETEWSLAVADGEGFTGDYNRLALLPVFGPEGESLGEQPVVAYQDSGNADLMVAYRSSGRWRSSRIAAAGLAGFQPEIALSRSGWAVLAHRELSLRDFRSRLRLLRVVPFAGGR